MIEVHFFHGFLGSPQDWQPVVRGIKNQEPFSFHFHNLYADYKKLGERASFFSWSEMKQDSLKQSDSCFKIFVGYSLGGRLALHLPPSLYDRLLLVGSQVNCSEDKQARKLWEQSWQDKASVLTPEEWMKEWNRLSIFKNDKKRPKRNYSSEELISWSQLMKTWSIRLQQNFTDLLQAQREKIFWGCGGLDYKYLDFRGQLLSLIGEEHIVEFPDAGHGVIFDQPQLISQWIEGQVKNVI